MTFPVPVSVWTFKPPPRWETSHTHPPPLSRQLTGGDNFLGEVAYKGRRGSFARRGVPVARTGTVSLPPVRRPLRNRRAPLGVKKLVVNLNWY